jgi:hypothetical protein
LDSLLHILLARCKLWIIIGVLETLKPILNLIQLISSITKAFVARRNPRVLVLPLKELDSGAELCVVGAFLAHPCA